MEGTAVEFDFHNLIHISVERIDQIIEYYENNIYIIHEKNKNHAWFPIDFIYIEIKWKDDELIEEINELYSNYETYKSKNHISDAYNPYYYLKFPKIPICFIGILLPLEYIEKYYNTYKDNILLQKKSHFENSGYDFYIQNPNIEPRITINRRGMSVELKKKKRNVQFGIEKLFCERVKRFINIFVSCCKCMIWRSSRLCLFFLNGITFEYCLFLKKFFFGQKQSHISCCPFA